MSYNTNCKLSYIGVDYAFATALKYLETPEKVIQNSIKKRYLFNGEGVREDEMDEAMKFVSIEFPGLTFKVHGEGEEAGDIHDAYYRNGKMVRYRAVMTLPSFDEGDLT